MRKGIPPGEDVVLVSIDSQNVWIGGNDLDKWPRNALEPALDDLFGRYLDKYLDKKKLRLRVKYAISAQNELVPGDYSIWMLRHSRNQQLLLSYGWTLAELTNVAVNATFDGTVFVDDAHMRDLLLRELIIWKDADDPSRGVRIVDWAERGSPLNATRAGITVSSAREVGAMKAIRADALSRYANADGRGCPILVWTHAQPPVDVKNKSLIEIFPATDDDLSGGSWVGKLIKSMVEGKDPETAFRETVQELNVGKPSLNSVSPLRLRNATHLWDSHTVDEKAAYYRQNIVPKIADAVTVASSATEKMIVHLSTADDEDVARKLYEHLKGELEKENSIVLVCPAWNPDPDPDGRVDAHVRHFEDSIARLSIDLNGALLWILHDVAVANSDALPAKELKSYIDKLRSVCSEIGDARDAPDSIHVHLVAVDPGRKLGDVLLVAPMHLSSPRPRWRDQLKKIISAK